MTCYAGRPFCGFLIFYLVRRGDVMRQLALVAVGLAGLVVISGLRIDHSHANAQGAQEGDPRTFAEYVHSALQTGDIVIVSDPVGGGYIVTLVRKDQVDQHPSRRPPQVVKEVHSDCIVLGATDAENTAEKGGYENVLPFDFISMFRKPIDNEAE